MKCVNKKEKHIGTKMAALVQTIMDKILKLKEVEK